MHSINKTTHFKHRDREKASAHLLSEKKLSILREPILKSIGRSVYHNGHRNKLCCEQKSCDKHPCHKDDRIDVANSAGVTGAQAQAQVLTNARSTATVVTRHHHQRHQRKLCHQCAANAINVLVSGGVSKCQNDLSSSNKTDCQRGAAQTNAVADPNNLMLNRIQNWRLADSVNVVDFKSLVNECNNLTLCAHGTSANNSIVELHKTRNFQILQANQIDDTAATRSDGDTNDGLNPTMQATTGISAMNCNLNNNSNNSSCSSTNSSSCSQQARMNSSNCDVTIDELASYIEFQLHLPKPMSSNVYEAMFS